MYLNRTASDPIANTIWSLHMRDFILAQHVTDDELAVQIEHEFSFWIHHLEGIARFLLWSQM